MRRLLADAGRRIDTELAGRPDVAAALHQTLGQAYLELVELDDAERHLRRAVELEPDGDAQRRVSLGAALFDAGRYDEAREALDVAIALATRRDDALAGARARRQLAMVHEVRLEMDAALDSLRAAERMLRVTDAHGERVTTLGALGIFYTYNLQRYDVADSILTLTSDVATSQNVDPVTRADTWQLHATVKKRQARYVEADSLYAMADSIFARVFEADHVVRASLRGAWAGSLELQERYDEAVELYRLAFEATQATYGNDHRETGTQANNLANCLRRAGRYDEARPYFELAEAAYSSVLGPEHAWTAITLANFAASEVDAGQGARAREIAARCLRITESYWGDEHWRVARVRGLLGAARVLVGDVAGESGMREGYEGLVAAVGIESEYTQRARERLRNHYQRTGRALPADLR